MSQDFTEAKKKGRKKRVFLIGKKQPVNGYEYNKHFYFKDSKPRKVNSIFTEEVNKLTLERKKATEKVIEYIEEEMMKTEYGKITIELKGHKSKVDVITEKRKRFEAKEESNSIENKEFRKG